MEHRGAGQKFVVNHSRESAPLRQVMLKMRVGNPKPEEAERLKREGGGGEGGDPKPSNLNDKPPNPKP